MVYITGDMHGDLSRFKNPIFKKLKAGDVLIVCGDFGFIWDGSRQEKQNLKKLREMPFTIAFVDGCHEILTSWNRVFAQSDGVAAGRI